MSIHCTVSALLNAMLYIHTRHYYTYSSFLARNIDDELRMHNNMSRLVRAPSTANCLNSILHSFLQLFPQRIYKLCKVDEYFFPPISSFFFNPKHDKMEMFSLFPPQFRDRHQEDYQVFYQWNYFPSILPIIC